MLSSHELQRYSRHLLLKEVGHEGQARLKQARVLLIGAGGLGAPVGQYLAAAGVGRLVIIDDDLVDVSNLQRQVIFNTDDIGQPKSLVASRRLRALNPHIEVEGIQARFSATNAAELVRQCDLVVDATDNFPTRFLANDACVLAGKPYVFGAVFRFDGQLSVFNFRGGPCYRCLFPAPPKAGTVPNCAEGGVLGVLPGIVGTMQANEALKIILQCGDVASGRLILFDALATAFHSIKVARDRLCPACGDSPSIRDLGANAVIEVDVKAVAQLLADGDILLLDVRTHEERSICAIKGAKHLSLDEIMSGTCSLDRERDMVLHCKSGVRSRLAAEKLMSMGYKKVRSMRGGILEWIRSVDQGLPTY